MAASTVTRQSNVGSELNAGSMDPDRAFDMIMEVAANMDNSGILRVLRKPLVPEPGKVADVEQSRVQAEQGGRAGKGRAGSRQQPASTGQCSGGAGGVLSGQDRLASQGVTPSDTPVVQVGGPLEGPHQAGGAQGAKRLGQTVEVGLRRSGRQRSRIFPYQAGSGGHGRHVGQVGVNGHRPYHSRTSWGER